ncbi:ABC transporter ATP-binding protein [Acidisphaera sp. L21]|uniref:ABC transporter ATP-binding protein n=1 Tax=Acidisphaera sp. L21 TaxID=1641851 RepID=UPI00131E74D3|nr:ABC transporter ATP-binding protein [Acidisphaera sp. L21]
MTAGAVALERVSKRFGGVAAVEDLSIAVAPGEFFTILGPSGSGKSTTLSMIAGFEVPDSGRILLGGQDMTRAAPRARGLGMVFQNYAIFPHLDVFENVAFPLRARGQKDVTARVMEALATVRLQGMERRYGRQLSGGQQQRVALARAIVARSAIVLMDEPLGALDKNLRYHMQTEIADIQRRLGMTVIFVTHDQEEAMNLSDRIAIMEGGRMIQAGAPREVYERPVNAFVARFLGESNLIAGVAEGAALRRADGTYLAAANVGTPGAASLFVRPEKVRLGAGSENSLSGRVLRSSFLGTLIRTEIDVGGDQVMTVDATNGPGMQALVPGAAAIVSWAAADSRLLAA